MPTVPINERRVKIGAPSISTPSVGSAVPGAFGEGVGQAHANLGATAVKTGVTLQEKIVQHANKMREWDEKAKAANFETEFLSQISGKLHNKETKEKDIDGVKYTIPAGYLDRTGEQARGALTEFDSEVKPLIAVYADKVKDPIIRQEMAQRLSSVYAANRDKINVHESTQWRKSKTDAFEANLLNDANNASSAISAAELGLYINNIIRTNETLSAFNGDPEEVKAKRQDEYLIKAVTNAAATTLKRTGNIGLSLGMLDSAKSQIPEKDYEEISDTLKTYKEKLDKELETQHTLFVNKRESSILDTWAAELDKPLAERTITPQFLRDEHKAGNIGDTFLKTLTNNVLSKEESRVKAEQVQAKNEAEAEILDAEIAGTLTEEQIIVARNRKKDPISPEFALARLNSVRARAAKIPEPSATQKDDAYISFTNRANEIEDNGATLEEIAKFQADVVNAHTGKFISDSDAKGWLKDTQGELDEGLNLAVNSVIGTLKPKKWYQALWGWSAKYESARPGMKTRMTKHLTSRLRKGEDATTALDAVIKNEVLLMNPSIMTAAQGGELRMDADGNLGIVFPDGTGKEITEMPTKQEKSTPPKAKEKE